MASRPRRPATQQRGTPSTMRSRRRDPWVGRRVRRRSSKRRPDCPVRWALTSVSTSRPITWIIRAGRSPSEPTSCDRQPDGSWWGSSGCQTRAEAQLGAARTARPIRRATPSFARDVGRHAEPSLRTTMFTVASITRTQLIGRAAVDGGFFDRVLRATRDSRCARSNGSAGGRETRGAWPVRSRW